MTSTLLVIFNIDDEDEVCRLFLPFWRKSGCDLLFSSPLDARSKLESVDHVHFGRKIDKRPDDYWFLQARMFDTFKYCLTLPREGFIFTQYDSICLSELPEIGPNDSIHHLAGGQIAGCGASFFLHPPWCFGRNRLRQFVEAASQYPINIERGFMDIWLSYIIEQNKIPWVRSDWSWSSNSIDCTPLVESARKAIQNGVKFVHGVKNLNQLNAILPPA